jgi:hypothetical protein
MISSNQPAIITRRTFLGRNALVLSASAVAMLAGTDILAATLPADASADVAILNVAVGLEYEGIGAYEIALKSGLLQTGTAEVARKFQDDHKAHVDALIATIRKMGGAPVAGKLLDDYAKVLKVDTLKNQSDVLTLAARLELGATNAYLGVIPAFKDSALAKNAGRLAADEAAHYSFLNYQLQRPFPAALGFGA